MAADRTSIGQQLQAIGGGWIEIVGNHEIFAEIDVLTFEMTLYQMRRFLVELQRKCFGRRLKVANRGCAAQFEVDPKMGSSLSRINVGPQRDREIGLQVLDWNR